jgi:hypothetical protein
MTVTNFNSKNQNTRKSIFSTPTLQQKIKLLTVNPLYINPLLESVGICWNLLELKNLLQQKPTKSNGFSGVSNSLFRCISDKYVCCWTVGVNFSGKPPGIHIYFFL